MQNGMQKTDNLPLQKGAADGENFASAEQPAMEKTAAMRREQTDKETNGTLFAMEKSAAARREQADKEKTAAMRREQSLRPAADFRAGEELKKRLKAEGVRPKLLLHSCCAPCSSAVIENLKEAFDLTLYYYNPNIAPESEYEKRKREQLRLAAALGIPVLDCDYDGARYNFAVHGLENEPERGARCTVCFRLRLQKTAEAAKQGGYDYFCTTLSVSPYKNATLLNEIGKEEGAFVGVPYFPSDFKKKGGYLRSVELARKYGLYRQDYCGCVYSKAAREKQKSEREKQKTEPEK